MSAPKVTVLMPVYNAEAYLPAAMESILRQDFADFEFLVIDDGSTDGSLAVAGEFRDPRIRILKNGSNRGLIATLNRGVEEARGQYLARMDADDVSLPQRLQRQVSFLDAHPEVAVCGAWLEAFDGATRTVWAPPLTDEEIRAHLLFESVIYHPTVMLRRQVLHGLPLPYDSAFPHAEDYALWSRLSRSCRFANVGEVLLRYRLHADSIGSRKTGAQAEAAGRVRCGLLGELGLQPTAAEARVHQALSTWQIEAHAAFLEEAHRWLLKVRDANRQRPSVAPQVLERVLARRWYDVCFLATPAGLTACRHFYRSELKSKVKLALRHQAVFAVRALLRRG